MNEQDSTRRRILVTGDVVLDHYLYGGRQRRPGSAMQLGTVQRQMLGGAALLHEIVENLPNVAASFGLDRGALGEVIPKGFCLMSPKPETAKAKNQVWRVGAALGFDGQSQPFSAMHRAADPLAADFDTVIIDDAGQQFRRWPSHDAWPPFLLDEQRALPAWLILKLSSPVAGGDLWHTLVSGETQEITPRTVRAPAALLSRTIGIVSVNDLRVEPIHVTKPLSWERSALDLTHELLHSPYLTALQKLRFLIVSFDTDGALLAEFSPAGEARFRLLFDPALRERDYNDLIDGDLFGFQSCLTAAVAAHLPKPNAPEDETRHSLERGICAGLCGMRRLLLVGHGPVNDAGQPVDAKFPTEKVVSEIMAAKHGWSYGAASVPVGAERREDWTIVVGPPVATPRPLWSLARRVAQRGVQELQQTPYLEFGKLFSIERTEIENLLSLRRLLLAYREDKKADKPLSIAAFGPPGAGKSFGVKQLAKAVFTDDVPLLEFNLSQFKEPIELNGLFHQIRDQALEGKLPVVFWDEFDSRELMWLQYLLAPMQDGKFQEGQVTHPIGKCIFVFAGGTRHRFEDFGVFLSEPQRAQEGLAEGEIPVEREQQFLLEAARWKADFKAKKGPDFKSRLAGYLNVLGPNQREARLGQPVDVTYPIRRALLLRIQLGVGPKERLIIDPGLLTAFLEVKEYRHGSRSLEKIAEQVRLASRTGEFLRSDLPSYTQLALHVDAQDFLSKLEHDA
jgi:hypothetical protein